MIATDGTNGRSNLPMPTSSTPTSPLIPFLVTLYILCMLSPRHEDHVLKTLGRATPFTPGLMSTACCTACMKGMMMKERPACPTPACHTNITHDTQAPSAAMPIGTLRDPTPRRPARRLPP
jgi:hypothetical protein